MIRFWKTLWAIKWTLVMLLTPIFLLPLPIIYASKSGRCAYGLLIMAVYWMTEVIPMEVTALLPVAIFPWLGVAPSKVLCSQYLKDGNMLFVGGLSVAVAVEKWNLHKRIAMKALLYFGSQPKWLMFGFMCITAFLSMWISNTATTAMMVPIAQAVLIQLKPDDPEPIITHNQEIKDTDVKISRLSDGSEKSSEIEFKSSERTNGSMNSIRPEGSQNYTDQKAKYANLCKGMMMSIAYAANIGGTATLTGTGPNLVIKGLVDRLYGLEANITFSSWFIYNFPNMVLTLGAAYLWLVVIFIGPRAFICDNRRGRVDNQNKAHMVIRSEYEKLGKFSFPEKMVLVHFVILTVLWFTRRPGSIPGWSYLFETGYVTDATAAITVTISLFLCPSRRPNYFCFRRKQDDDDPSPSPALLDWYTVHHQLSWGVLILRGGGFALAEACRVSGLSEDIAKVAPAFHGITPWVLVLVMCIIMATVTEFTSNVATAAIFLPILAELAESIGMNPLYLMIPTTVATSFSFMLPVATAPNAIVFSFGYLKLSDMIKIGFMMNIICILILQFSINTWGFAYFSLGTFPSWAGNFSAVADTLALNTTLT